MVQIPNNRTVVFISFCLAFFMLGFILYYPVNDLSEAKYISNNSQEASRSDVYQIDIQDEIELKKSDESSSQVITFDKDEVVSLLPEDSTSQLVFSNSVVTNSYSLENSKTYKIDLSDKVYSSIVFKWDNGEISVGNSIVELSRLDPTPDLQSSGFIYISELIYDLGPVFYIRSNANSEIKIDIFDTITPRSEPKIATTNEIVNKDSGAKYSTLPIISRDSWGASTNLWDPYDHSDIDDVSRFTWYPGYYRASRFVIHHTATSNTTDDPSRAVRDIYLYHAYSRGWGDIGYNFLIDQWGNIYEGKAGGDEVFGYHAYQEANTMSVGISLIGNFELYPPTTAQKEALKNLLAEKAVFYDLPLNMSNGTLEQWLDEDITVFGDNDSYLWCYQGHPLDYNCPTSDRWIINNKACPGRYLKELLPIEIIPQARGLMAQYGPYLEISSVVSKVDMILEDIKPTEKEFIVVYDLPDDIDPNIVENKIPSYSGILDYDINGNQVKIILGDWNDGILVPYYGWTGFFDNTYFPMSEGPIDRMRTLMKVFLLDPEVKSVGINKQYVISPIE